MIQNSQFSTRNSQLGAGLFGKSPRQHNDTDQHHGYGKQLSHGDLTEHEANVLVRLSEHFHEQAAEAVAGQETPEDGAWRCGPPSDDPK